MPLIMPIKDLRNTTEISNIAHKEQEPIFITKNGYSDVYAHAFDKNKRKAQEKLGKAIGL